MTDISLLINDHSKRLNDLINRNIDERLREIYPDAAFLADELKAERARSEWLMDLLEDHARDVHRAIVTGELGIGDRS